MSALNDALPTVNDESEPIEIEDTSAGNVAITHPFSPSEFEFTTPPMNMGDLIEMLQHDEINLTTNLLREGIIWDQQTQSKLIESILLGLRLPAFYFDKVSPSRWNVIDGLQRCLAIKNFCIDKRFSLTGLEFLKGEGIENCTFDQLAYEYQRVIKRSQITVNLLSIGGQKRAKYILFERLNSGGMTITPQEIRNVVYQGQAIDLIKNLSNCPQFLTATCKKIPTIRKEADDFASRFVSFYITDYKEYLPDLETFVNINMDKLYKFTIDEIEKIKSDFKNAMILANDIFGEDAFRKRNVADAGKKPINKAYFEVIAVIFSKLNEDQYRLLKQNKELFKSNLLVIMNNSRYWNSLTAGTGQKDSVTIRFSWFHETVLKSLESKKIKITDDYKIEGCEL